MAKFYGIGTGPGDSSLLTVKAVDTLKNIDVLYTPEAPEKEMAGAPRIVTYRLWDSMRLSAKPRIRKPNRPRRRS